MEVEKPTINSRIVRSPSTEPQDLCVYGSTVVEFYGDHVRISLDDWNKYKQRLIPVLKQGDMKYGSTDTEAGKVGIGESSAARSKTANSNCTSS